MLEEIQKLNHNTVNSPKTEKIESPIKRIQVKLFDDKRDTVTGDRLYWVNDNCLFPFEMYDQKLGEDAYDLEHELDQVLALSKVPIQKRVTILARLTKKYLVEELREAEAKENQPYEMNDEFVCNTHGWSSNEKDCPSCENHQEAYDREMESRSEKY